MSAMQLEIYSLHNGLPLMNILPLATILPVTQLSQSIDQFYTLQSNWHKINSMGVVESFTFDQTQLKDCLIVGGFESVATDELIPIILWCPNSEDHPLVDLQNSQIYSDFRRFIQYKTANKLAMEHAF